MGNKPIDWEKIESQPDKEHKILGKDIITFRSTIEGQKGEIDRNMAAIKALGDEKQKLQSMMQSERERADDLAKKVESLKDAAKDGNAYAQTLERENEATVQALKARIQQLETLEKELASKLDMSASTVIEKEGIIAEKESAIAALKSEIIKVQEQNKQVVLEKENVVASTKAEKEKLEQEMKSLEDQRDTLVDKVMELEDKVQKPVRITPAEDVETVRACVSCKQYVLAKEEYKYIQAMHLFEAAHRTHMLATLTYADVKKEFSTKTQEFLDKVQQ